MGTPARSFSTESVAAARRRREAISAFIRVLASPTTGPYGRLVGGSSGAGSMTPARPGTGGRRTRVDAGFRTEATRELRERFGEPLQLREAGVTLEAWPVDPDGDGIVGVRLSSRDVQQGETAFGQVHACLELCERHTINPSWVVVTCHCSGAMDFDDRPDFRFFRERILEGGIRWMAWRHTDRIARHQLPAELFYRLLEENDVSLYLAHVGRKMDWLRDRAFLLTFGMVGEMERQLIKDRTHSAIIRRYLEPGRGYPTAKKVGFRRAADKYLEVDPEQWPYIERVHHDYATLFENGTTSLRKLAEHMGELGFPLSHQKLKDILTDRIYVDGEWASEYDGTVYRCRPIPLPSPIPAEVFERNQLLLSTRRGSNRKTPPGHFLLQGVPVRHARCADFVDERGISPRLNGRRNYRLAANDDRGVYGHTYKPPCCENYQPIDAASLERVVIEQVLRLAEDPELQAAWAHNAALKSSATAALGVLGPEQRAMMEVKIRNLERQRDRHEREWLDALADGAQLPVDHLARVTSGLDQEIERYRNHLDVDDRVRRERDALGAQRSELLGRLREVLTFEPPSDPDLRIRRNWAIRAIVSEVIVDDSDGGFLVELRGPLVPAGGLFRPADPARDAADSADGATRKPSSNPS